MLNGIRSVVYFSDNLREAAAWYEHILGVTPYRNEEHFVGFHLDEYDFCLHPIDEKSGDGVPSQVMYWIVDDLETTVDDLLGEGCTLYRNILDAPEGGKVVQLMDPFGNILGLSEVATPQTPPQ